MRNYLVDFLRWWYLVKLLDYLSENVVGRFVLLMNLANTLPMLKNFRVPLFQDNSSLGKSLSLFIKFWWIILGTVSSALRTTPNFVIFLVLLLLPILPIIQLILFIFKLGQ